MLSECKNDLFETKVAANRRHFTEILIAFLKKMMENIWALMKRELLCCSAVELRLAVGFSDCFSFFNYN